MKRLFLILFVFAIQVLSAAPVITSVTPAVGPTAGGTVIQIQGSGFTGATGVFFGSVNTPAASFIVNSDNSITATTPAHSALAVNVMVQAPSGTSASSPQSVFTFQGDLLGWVINVLAHTVTQFNVTTNTFIANDAINSNPADIAVSPDGTRIFVTDSAASGLTVANSQTGATIAGIITGVSPDAILIVPNGQTGYVVNIGSNTVTCFNVNTLLVTATIPVGFGPVGMALHGTTLYVTCNNSNAVFVIDTTTNTVVGLPIAVGTLPVGIVVTPDGSKVYVANVNSNNVSVIRTSTNTVIATIPVGAGPSGLAVTPDSSLVLVTNETSNTVSVINTATNTVIMTIPVGTNPVAAVVTPDGTKAYVANSGSGNVSVINTTSLMVSTTVTVGTTPLFLAFGPGAKNLYVSNFSSNNLSVIQTSTDTVIATIPTDIGPDAMITLPDQAPFASFTFAQVPGTMQVNFDASASTTPTGTIVSYQWNFGDGSMLTTASPLTSHVYTVPGAYTVTLTVTNSQGTSSASTFIVTSEGGNGGQFLATASVTGNGSSSQSINVSPAGMTAAFPPTNLTAVQLINKFINRNDRVNVLTWNSPSQGTIPVEYLIFRDPALTILAGTVDADDRRFEDHFRHKNVTYQYFVVTVDVNGNVSAPAVAIVQ